MSLTQTSLTGMLNHKTNIAGGSHGSLCLLLSSLDHFDAVRHPSTKDCVQQVMVSYLLTQLFKINANVI